MNQESLKSILNYSLETGVFKWASPRPKIRVGDVAGGLRGGYRRIRIDGRKYTASRLAFLWMTGEFPKGEIDHLNGDRDDNRWINLRDVTRVVNQQNERCARATNVLGILGVSQEGKKFCAQIRHEGKNLYLGSFDTPALAHAAYVHEKRKLHAGCTL